jgi:hypothetical protein
MTVQVCSREPEVIRVITAGRWPDQCDDTLRTHVGQCEVCREVAALANLLHLERDDLDDEMTLPAAGQVWWRAAIRARLEASQQATRPLSWAFGIGVACLAGLALAVVELLWSPMQLALRSTATSGWTMTFRLGDITRWLPSLSDLTPLTTAIVVVVLGAAACLVLAPLALYFALSDE